MIRKWFSVSRCFVYSHLLIFAFFIIRILFIFCSGAFIRGLSYFYFQSPAGVSLCYGECKALIIHGIVYAGDSFKLFRHPAVERYIIRIAGLAEKLKHILKICRSENGVLVLGASHDLRDFVVAFVPYFADKFLKDILKSYNSVCSSVLVNNKGYLRMIPAYLWRCFLEIFRRI